MRILVDHLDNEVGPEAGVGFAFRGRQVDVGKAVCAVPELRGDEFLEKRMLRSACDGDVAATGQGSQLQRVFQPLFGVDVTGDDGNGAHIEFRGGQSQHDRECIVSAGVGIDDDFLGSRRRGFQSRRICGSCRGN